MIYQVGEKHLYDSACELPPFLAFKKIPRLYREVIITEKIDGTNAAVYVGEDGRVLAASRHKWLIGEDNHGFGAWVIAHAYELRDGLGPGLHRGEWWGKGIQRGYELKEKRFSLFNVERWGNERPECCHVVPTLYRGMFDTQAITMVMHMLDVLGSQAAPGFMEPEGIVIYHTQGEVYFKATLQNDDVPKTIQLEHGVELERVA